MFKATVLISTFAPTVRTFDGAEGKWSDSYFKEICLSDLDYDKVGKPSEVRHPGTKPLKNINISVNSILSAP